MRNHCLKLLLVVVVYQSAYCRSNRVRRIVGGLEADVAPFDEPVAYLRYAERSATVRGVLDTPHYSFRGIRYAHSPVGVNRFQKPKKYILYGDYNATDYPSPCLQPLPGTDQVVGSEDCLFLNIYTPKLPEGDEGLPVIVWIHGGGFRYGSASQYGAKYLMKKNVILVTIQYRLGSLGFLSTGQADFPGNAGLFDMAMAIEWTKNYIGFFGGNAKKISVMGQGTGASSAMLLALSNIAKGIPCSAIAMSGSAISSWAIDKTPSNTAKEVAELQNCNKTTIVKSIKCLQKVPAEAIIKGDNQIESTRLEKRGFISGLSGLLGSCPVNEGVHDGRSLPPAIQHEPIDDLNAGRIPKIPLLTGITKDETKKAVNDQYKEEILSQIKNIPDFLNKAFVQNLLSVTSLIGNSGNQSNPLLGALDPLHLGSYLHTTTKTIADDLTKVAEATSDALFNLPAFVTADLWSKSNMPSFLYRFEHTGNAPKGRTFLRGLPLVSNHAKVEENDTVSHGDELAYLFEAQNLDGSPLEGTETYDEKDEKVRDLFTQIIADFALNGKIRVNNQALPGFTGKSNNYVQISSEPKLSDQFRYCEMGLWAGLADRLKDASCQVQDSLLNVVGAPLVPLAKVPSQLSPNTITGPLKPKGSFPNWLG